MEGGIKAKVKLSQKTFFVCSLIIVSLLIFVYVPLIYRCSKRQWCQCLAENPKHIITIETERFSLSYLFFGFGFYDFQSEIQDGEETK